MPWKLVKQSLLWQRQVQEVYRKYLLPEEHCIVMQIMVMVLI